MAIDLAGRVLALSGVMNVRDIGGYPSAFGGRTRWRVVLRGDSPHRLDDVGQQALAHLGIRLIVDLRRPREAAEAPYCFARVGLVRQAVPLLDDDLPSGVRTLPEVYHTILAHAGSRLVTVYRALLQEGPTLVHCTAGKDRTGLTVAVLLAALGVPAPIIAEDYALSGACLRGTYWEEARQRALRAGMAWEAYLPLLGCPPALMLDTLDLLQRRYGGAEAYLLAAGLTPAELASLRSLLLE
jgi:protein-tyrosine phosphatase